MTLAVGESATFKAGFLIEGDKDHPHTNTVTATANDNENNPATADGQRNSEVLPGQRCD